MKVIQNKESCKIYGEESSILTVIKSNLGEPYRDCIEIILEEDNQTKHTRVFLEDREALELLNFLNNLYKIK